MDFHSTHITQRNNNDHFHTWLVQTKLLFRCAWSENSLKYAFSIICSVISRVVNIYAN